ncbi:hypothetical protein [Halobacillus amylolyticus]|uniref:Uncharacterized protein n=1 Tax=Halobacillus amylolyticus TaxID=2932259 RepID=A0ABY4HF14_9BACI|nr:hypothetical protein [Halobacillus amylolyticus]UOR12888.1 hypothetical protein MUO15_05095 [Halobacillus amylolyticus]
MAKVLASVMMVINVLFIFALANNNIASLCFLALTAISVFYLFYEKDSKTSNNGV